MDNQHRQIKGYRELDQSEIDAMNKVKDLGVELGAIIEAFKKEPAMDQRWVSIGATDLQKGLMAAVRAIAKPTLF